MTFFLINLFLFFFASATTYAISDPLAVPNNKLGIHILFPDEISKAADIVNNHKQGQWGYVVVPIQNTDRDRSKWQHFFDKCSENKIVPIIRVATTANGPHWELPSEYDLIDFANFLNDLDWPIKNRYVIVLNEVNRDDEFGGIADPEGYADFLNLALDVFKGKSEDFFIMPAGLDNAASDRKTSIMWSDFLDRMYRHRADIFSRIDGWVSHAYPNPNFSARVDEKGSNKIDSFNSDLQRLRRYTAKNLPVFITETGWSENNLSEKQIGLYYNYAFEHIWDNPQIVVVAPFLLNAQEGPFVQFSFLGKDNKEKDYVKEFALHATVGQPELVKKIVNKLEEPILLASASAQESTQASVLSVDAEVKSKPKYLQNIYNKVKLFFLKYVHNLW